jgi:hypothetical protein
MPNITVVESSTEEHAAMLAARRWLHELGWVEKRPTWVANDDDLHRVARLARMRWIFEPLQCGEALVGADHLDSYRWPTVACAWMSKGTHLEVATPGQHQQHDLAGALDLAPGTLLPWVAARKPNARVRDLVERWSQIG